MRIKNFVFAFVLVGLVLTPTGYAQSQILTDGVLLTELQLDTKKVELVCGNDFVVAHEWNVIDTVGDFVSVEFHGLIDWITDPGLIDPGHSFRDYQRAVPEMVLADTRGPRNNFIEAMGESCEKARGQWLKVFQTLVGAKVPRAAINESIQSGLPVIAHVVVHGHRQAPQVEGTP